jgi:hypothetical protein
MPMFLKMGLKDAHETQGESSIASEVLVDKIGVI